MGEVIATEVTAGSVALWWLGQSGYVLKTPGGAVALIDPYLSDSRSDGGRHARRFPPPLAPADVHCDVVFCTHDHPDHTDPETLLPILARTESAIVAPETCCARLARLGAPAHRLHRFSAGDRYVHRDLTVTAAFALHGGPGPPERLPRRPVPDPIGLLVECGPVRFYHTGDTLYDPRLRAAAAFRPRALFVCTNGRGGNMNAEEAAALVAEIGPEVAVPMHYGCIPVNDADPQEFVAAVRAARTPSAVVLLETARRYDLQGAAPPPLVPGGGAGEARSDA
jgi:L-ascorbate 6-phosphate lactonase